MLNWTPVSTSALKPATQECSHNDQIHTHIDSFVNVSFWVSGEDTPNTTEDRDTTFTSAARFFDTRASLPAFALFCRTSNLHFAGCCVVLAQCRLAYCESPVFDQQPGWEEWAAAGLVDTRLR